MIITIRAPRAATTLAGYFPVTLVLADDRANPSLPCLNPPDFLSRKAIMQTWFVGFSVQLTSGEVS